LTPHLRLCEKGKGVPEKHLIDKLKLLRKKGFIYIDGI
jgi:hypothetical protein